MKEELCPIHQTGFIVEYDEVGRKYEWCPACEQDAIEEWREERGEHPETATEASITEVLSQEVTNSVWCRNCEKEFKGVRKVLGRAFDVCAECERKGFSRDFITG